MLTDVDAQGKYHVIALIYRAPTNAGVQHPTEKLREGRKKRKGFAESPTKDSGCE